MNELYLCFNNNNGLYVSACPVEKEIKYTAHEERREINRKIEIPEKLFSVTINSKLGYKNVSYLSAKIQVNGARLLNFDSSYLSRRNDCNLDVFYVSPKDDKKWKILFAKIIDAYNRTDKFYRDEDIKTYLVSLEKLAHAEEINYLYSWQDLHCIKDPLQKLMYYSEKLKDLLLQTRNYTWFYDDYKEYIFQLCKTFFATARNNIQHIQSTDSNTQQNEIADTLNIINQTLSKKGDSKYFMKLCFGLV